MITTSGHGRLIYTLPKLTTTEDMTVLDEIHAMRRELAVVLRVPRRWEGGLRRTMLARAIRGSNSIEGYVVAEDDAAAALDGDAPLTADSVTFAEIRGYRQALGRLGGVNEACSSSRGLACLRQRRQADDRARLVGGVGDRERLVRYRRAEPVAERLPPV